jgi:MFS family permease
MEVHWNGVSQTLGTSGSSWPTIPEEPSFGYRAGEKLATSNRPVGFWDRLITKFGRKKIIVTLIVIAGLLIILAVLLGVLLRKKSNLPTCPVGKTGTYCDIGMFTP